MVHVINEGGRWCNVGMRHPTSKKLVPVLTFMACDQCLWGVHLVTGYILLAVGTCIHFMIMHFVIGHIFF